MKMVACFDTAFHQTIAKDKFIYPLPYEYYEKYGIRKYGFHGISHEYVSKRIAEIMNKDVKDLKIISCHLGQGASLCAIKNGKSVDTTMGLTPLGRNTYGVKIWRFRSFCCNIFDKKSCKTNSGSTKFRKNGIK